MGVPFDRIFSSSPLNKTAGAVTGSGEHYEREFKGGLHSALPLPTIPFPKKPPASLPNLAGMQRGRLTVLGIHDNPEAKGGLRWVVRCACGAYEIRTTKALRAELVWEGNSDRCQSCAHTLRLQRKALERRTVEDFLAENGVK